MLPKVEQFPECGGYHLAFCAFLQSVANGRAIALYPTPAMARRCIFTPMHIHEAEDEQEALVSQYTSNLSHARECIQFLAPASLFGRRL
jgi:hypothetical protein